MRTEEIIDVSERNANIKHERNKQKHNKRVQAQVEANKKRQQQNKKRQERSANRAETKEYAQSSGISYQTAKAQREYDAAIIADREAVYTDLFDQIQTPESKYNETADAYLNSQDRFFVDEDGMYKSSKDIANHKNFKQNEFGSTRSTAQEATPKEYIDLTTNYKDARGQAEYAVKKSNNPSLNANKAGTRQGPVQTGGNMSELIDNFNDASSNLTDYEIAKGHVKDRRLNYRERKTVKMAQRAGHIEKGSFDSVSYATTQEVMDSTGKITKGSYKFKAPDGTGGGSGGSSTKLDSGNKLSRFNRSGKVRFNTIMSGAFAISDYNESRKEGKTVMESVGSAAFQAAKSEILGMGGLLALGAIKAIPKGAVSAYNEVQSVNRSMNNLQRLAPLDNVQFQDTQQLATMRQSGMELAKMANYNLQQTLMGTEARYLHR